MVKKRFNQTQFVPDRNRLTGELPEGCRVCLKGAKAVIFVTGLCSVNPPCYYCPVSIEKRGKDIPYVYVNERKTHNTKEIIAECEKMDAEGASISGGDPLTRLDRSLQIIKDLKTKFGDQFHIHLYTTGLSATKKSLEALHDVRLDEIRFHTVDKLTKKAIQMALEYPSWAVGVEIPAIPGELEIIKETMWFLNKININFMNLNELELSESNYRQLLARGFIEDKDRPFTVIGSEKIAKKALEWGSTHTHLTIHYCSASTKDGVQLKNRLIRTAKKIARPYHEITEEGLLIVGTIVSDKANVHLRTAVRLLREKFRVPRKLIFLHPTKKRIETRWDIVESLAPFFKKKGFSCAIVEKYPTADELQTTYLPL
ncbi:MAG: radical SAM protein [Candidatus Heimdallarchaeota archaeon]